MGDTWELTLQFVADRPAKLLLAFIDDPQSSQIHFLPTQQPTKEKKPISDWILPGKNPHLSAGAKPSSEGSWCGPWLLQSKPCNSAVMLTLPSLCCNAGKVSIIYHTVFHTSLIYS